MKKKTVKYHKQHGSYAFVCYTDFCKAFDNDHNVDYSLLFWKLIYSNKGSLFSAFFWYC